MLDNYRMINLDLLVYNMRHLILCHNSPHHFLDLYILLQKYNYCDHNIVAIFWPHLFSICEGWQRHGILW
jgi:hypothetical protein